jgi:hypothetical protein
MRQRSSGDCLAIVSAIRQEKEDMSHNLRSLIQEHHAFYEVSPYYVFDEQNHGSVTAKAARRVQTGFDIDIYGVNRKNDPVVPGWNSDYTLGYVELKKIAENVSRQHTDLCCIEVIPFPERGVFDNRNRAMEAMLRIRISHYRGLDQPAGVSEQHVLREFETELQALGITRR